MSLTRPTIQKIFEHAETDEPTVLRPIVAVALRDHIAALEAQLSAANLRADSAAADELERAAKACESVGARYDEQANQRGALRYDSYTDSSNASAARRCRDAILALIPDASRAREGK